MRAKVIIDHEVVKHDNKEYAFKAICEGLIKQQKIDEEFYYVNIEKISEAERNFATYNISYYVEYSLERKECWDDLKECEERLKIGL